MELAPRLALQRRPVVHAAVVTVATAAQQDAPRRGWLAYMESAGQSRGLPPELRNSIRRGYRVKNPSIKHYALSVGASRRFYIASGASEEIVWADDFSLPSPANARRDARGMGSPPARVRSSTNRRTAEERLPTFRFPSMSATIFDTATHSACAMSFNVVQNSSSRLTLVL